MKKIEMDKLKILQAVRKELESKYEIAKAAVQEAYKSATHEENVAENKYDTKGLEASYLVQGQARRLEELEIALSAYRAMEEPLEDKNNIHLGSLIKVEEEGVEQYLFMGPQSGGLKVEFDNLEVLIVTFFSPIGRALKGKTAGDSIEVQIGRKIRNYKIVELY